MLTHFRFVFECIIAAVTNAMEMRGALTSKATKISSTLFRCTESLESKRKSEKKISIRNDLEMSFVPK